LKKKVGVLTQPLSKRTKIAVSDFQVGMIAFLPYYGKLRKSKITHLTHRQIKTEAYVVVQYVVFCDLPPRHGNMCIMKITSEYEIYTKAAKP